MSPIHLQLLHLIPKHSIALHRVLIPHLRHRICACRWQLNLIRLLADRSLPVAIDMAIAIHSFLIAIHNQLHLLRQRSDLSQRSRRVPGNMFMIKPVTSHIYNSHHRDLNVVVGRWHAWEEPVDYHVVGELVDELVDDAVDSCRARDELQLGVFGVGEDEVVAIEVSELRATDAACELLWQSKYGTVLGFVRFKLTVGMWLT